MEASVRFGPVKEKLDSKKRPKEILRTLTRRGVKGAKMAPIRPIVEHKFVNVLRKLVGHNSAVKT